MFKKILLLIFFIIAASINTYAEQRFIVSSQGDLFYNAGSQQKTLIQSFSYGFEPELFEFGDFLIFSGQDDIGIFIFDIKTQETFALNSAGDHHSPTFYSNFLNNNNLFFTEVGIDATSASKFCLYNLDILSEKLTKNRGSIDSFLNSDDVRIAPNLYEFTIKNDISYCTFGDPNNYYNFNWTDKNQISYSFTPLGMEEFSDDGYDKFYPTAINYVSDWNGENKELVSVRKDGKDFSEVFLDLSSDHPLFFTVYEAVSQGWISGYPDNTVRLNDPVNRAEFAKMLTKAFKQGIGNGENLRKFPDVDLTQWYKPYLSKAVELGSMSGYPDGQMRPGNSINRAEALKMAIQLTFNRLPELPEDAPWYEGYRQYAIDNDYRLDFLEKEDMAELMTRGECIELILKALEDLGPG